jgi:ribonuclease HI
MDKCLELLEPILELDLDWDEDNKPEIFPLKKNLFDNSKYDLWHHQNKAFVPIFTDGSKKDTKAASAVYWKKNSSENWKDRTSGKQTSINAELQAFEKALAEAPIDRGMKLIIFSDSTSAISLIQNDRSYSHEYKSEYRGTTNRLRNNIQMRHQLFKQSVEFVWIPSHSTEKELTELKKQQMETLKETFGPQMLKQIVDGNACVDSLAKTGTTLTKILSGNIRIAIMPKPLPRTPNGLPRANFIEKASGTAYEGDLRRHIKSFCKEKHKNKKLQNSHHQNHDKFDISISGNILQSNNPKLDGIQKFMIQTSINNVRSPMKLFSYTVKKPKSLRVFEPISSPYKSDELKLMTVPELKGLCSKHGFMKKGNKVKL